MVVEGLFNALIEGGEATLRKMLEQRTSEGVDLEFKRKASPEHSGFEKPDKAALGSTVSAFANSAGGLLVFGVEARRGADGVDCMVALQPINGIEAFAAEAARPAPQYLLPRFDGVRMHAVPTINESGKGYLAIMVERSERRPHQSKAPDDGRYYKRAGDSTFVMEHFDVEDAFRRTVSPTLSLSYSLQAGGSFPRADQGGRIHEVTVTLEIAVEDGIARSPYLHLLDLGGLRPEDWSDVKTELARLKQTEAVGETRFDGNGNDVFHPGIAYPAARLKAPLVKRYDDGIVTLDGVAVQGASSLVRYRLGAEGTRPLIGELRIDGNHLLASARLDR